jgi:hypothetical protein
VPIEATASKSASTLRYRIAVYSLPASEWWTTPAASWPARALYAQPADQADDLADDRADEQDDQRDNDRDINPRTYEHAG